MAEAGQREGTQFGGGAAGGNLEVQPANASFEETFAAGWLNSGEVTLGGAMGVLESKLSATLAPLHASIAQGTVHHELSYRGKGTPNELRARLAEVTDWGVAGSVAPQTSRDGRSRLLEEATRKHIESYGARCRNEIEGFESELESLQKEAEAIEEMEIESLPSSKQEELARIHARFSILEEVKGRYESAYAQETKHLIARSPWTILSCC